MVTPFVSKRGARRRKKSAFSMSIANTTSWWSCRVFVATSLSDVLFLQEAKVTADMLPGVQNTVFKSGWRGAFSSAISTSRLGASEGVALLARTHLGMCSMAYGADANWSHEVESGRRFLSARSWLYRGVLLSVSARWCGPGRT